MTIKNLNLEDVGVLVNPSPLYRTAAPINGVTVALDGQLVRVSPVLGVGPFSDFITRRTGLVATTVFTPAGGTPAAGSVTAAMLAPGAGLDTFTVANRTITRPGLPVGVLLTGATVVDVLTNLLYPAVPPGATITLGGDRDLGAPTTLTIGWTATQNTNPITAITVGGATQPLSPLSGSVTNQTLSTNTAAASKTIVVTAGADVTTVTATVNHLPRMHWGSIPAGAVTAANLRTVLTNSDLRTTRQRTFATIGTGGGQRIAVAIPTSFGAPNFTIGGFPNTDFTSTVLASYTNAFGVTVPMTVWISNQFYNSPLDNFIIS